MLKFLLIQNFQKHEKLKIEFDPKITVISGSSDVGKSSVLRALKWVCLNNPQGEAFIRKGSKGTTVQLFVDDNKIKRKRSKSLNAYYLNDEEYKAFGQDVPDTISSILKMDEINFQGQQDAPFWFSLSAGEVSRQLNSVIDLSIIDDALSAIGKKVRHFQSVTQISKERLKNAKDHKEELDWITQADTVYCSIESLKEQQTITDDSKTSLSSLMVSIKNQIKVQHRASSQLKSLNSIGILGQNVRTVGKLQISLSELIIEIKKQEKIINKGKPDTSKLDSIVDQYNDVNKQYILLSKSIIETKKLQKISDRKKPDISKLDSIVEEYNKVNEKKEKLKKLIGNLKWNTKEMLVHKVEKHIADKELEEQTEGICPICGGELNNV